MAAVQSFAGTINDAVSNKLQRPVGEHFRVQTKVLVPAQTRANGIWHGTDTHLQAGPVGNKFRAMLSDSKVRGRWLGVLRGNQRPVIGHQCGESFNRNQLSVREGHLRIHHRNTLPGNVQGSHRAVHRSSQRHHAIHRLRHLHHCNIARQGAVAVHGLRFVQINRQIIGHSGLNRGAKIRPHEEALIEERFPVIGLSVRRRPLRMEVVEMHVAKL